MKKLNLKNVKEFAEFKLPIGGFICKIVEAEENEEKEYFKLKYDIIGVADEKDKDCIDMYTQRKKDRDFDYPSFIVSYKETAWGMMKGFSKAFDKSNNRDHDDENIFYTADELKGGKIGLVLGEEEYENQKGEIKTRSYVVTRVSVQDIKNGDFKMPTGVKKLKPRSGVRPEDNPFLNVEVSVGNNEVEAVPLGTDITDDDVPF